MLHYVLMLAFQPACRHCAFTLAHAGSSKAGRALAAAAFFAGPVAFLWHVAHVLRVRVGRERRAALIQDAHRTGNILCWMDMLVVSLQSTYLDWTPRFSQLWPGCSFPCIALHFHDRAATGAWGTATSRTSSCPS